MINPKSPERISTVLGLDLRHLVAQYFSYGLVLIISFGLSIFIAREFGPKIFSVYSTSLSVGAILAIINDFGFKSLIQRETSFSSDGALNSPNTILSNAIIHATVMSCLSSLFLCLIFREFVFTIISISICFYGVTVSQFISSWLKGKQLFARDGTNNFLLRIVSALSILSIFSLENPMPEFVFLAWGISLLIYNLVVHSWAFKFVFTLPSKSNYKILVPLFSIDICIVLYFRFDVILLQYLGGLTVEIGNYSAALRVIEAFILLTMPLRGMLLSLFRKEYFSSNSFFQSFFIKLIIMGLLGLLIALLIGLNANSIITLLYGKQYFLAGKFLFQLSWLIIPAMLLAIITEMVVASENEKTYFMVAFTILIITLPTTYLLADASGIKFIPIMKVFMESIFCLIGLITISYKLKKL
jgi:O-antigen/teichoic acid export membrane protein